MDRGFRDSGGGGGSLASAALSSAFSSLAAGASRIGWATGLLAAGVAAPVQAQEDYRAIVMSLRACAEIGDRDVRVRCYDSGLAPPAGGGQGPAPGPAVGEITARAAAAREPEPPRGFGSEMVRPPREAAGAQADRGVRAEVARVDTQAPGILLLTLADGAQWRFVDAAPMSYAAPRPGETVALERGSLGSVFLSYAGQRRLRVMRIR